jgi:2-methylcitrate dehydratase PrpD
VSDSDCAAKTLAQAAASCAWRQLPPEVRARTLDLFADGLAVIAGGAVHPTMQALMSQLQSPSGPATLIGEKRGAVTREAIFLNAATTTVLQRQDGYAHAKGHPASQLVPVVLALAEQNHSSPAAMLSAMVAGYEVACRVGVALGGVPPWLHDNGNWATIGNAVAAAHVLCGGNAAKLAAAIDGAASLGLSFDRFTTAAGATIHHLYPATATTHALAIAQGAVAGLTALPGSLERFYGPRLGTDFDPEKLTHGVRQGAWTRYEILHGYFKLHPSCAHLHGVNDAVEALLAEHQIKEEDLDRIEVATFGEAMEIDTDTPRNDLAARFSAKATVAAALRHGRLDDDGLLDLDGLAPLMEKITVRHEPELDQYTPAGRPGAVTLLLRNGQTLKKDVIYPRGTPQVAATPKERRDKALRLLARHYGNGGAERVYHAVLSLGEADDLAALTDALRGNL